MAASTTTNPITTPPTFQPHRHYRKKDKIVVIMGATGTGKSRLSVDLATRYFPSEIINSDKMQVYKGLDITTNKISLHERQNIPHHFLGEFDSQDGELTPLEFRHLAHLTISDIVSRKRTPFIVGGSNSFIYSLLVQEYNPRFDALDAFNSVSSSLRYNCCFLWVDSSLPVLYEYLDKRVDEMFETGMFEELEEYFRESEELKYCVNSVSRSGLRKAIGLPEFERYFREYPAEEVTP
ncbi:adenylate isopentenyltransferase-like [Pistacia vera]|uniref:adenylate isopentenyltransferase-like n=1 Tax=Pistacia vera TaxID=55513 RepID=UPI001262C631|nr:adenylate isopentenyltransferase-like [Pistacia vera]